MSGTQPRKSELTDGSLAIGIVLVYVVLLFFGLAFIPDRFFPEPGDPKPAVCRHLRTVILDEASASHRARLAAAASNGAGLAEAAFHRARLAAASKRFMELGCKP